MIDILNHSTAGHKAYESISGGISFVYLSDIDHPGIEFNGKISAGKNVHILYLQ